MKNISHWKGIIPPQYIYSNRRFKGVVVNPPNFTPGSWCGAGKAIYDPKRDEFIISSRPRMAKNDVRGFCVDVYASDDGVNNFSLVCRLTKEEITEISGIDTHSIEGNQILRDPLTGNWHFYISIDTGEEFVWGGMNWQTLLLKAPNLSGPWDSEGLVLRNDQEYDANQARNGSIDIIDGKYYCIYKADDKERQTTPGFATSIDGIHWEKKGNLTLDGKPYENGFQAFLSGTFFSGTNGPIFIGLERLHGLKEEKEQEERQGSSKDTEKPEMEFADEKKVKHGSGLVNFAAYELDEENLNLKKIFTHEWIPLSPYEFKGHPLLGFSTMVEDPKKNRLLMYIEAMDPHYTEKMGLNETVERVLVYEIPL